MFFYAGTRHKRPLISHKAREHAGQRFKDFFGEKLGGLGRAAQQEVRGRDTTGRMYNATGKNRDDVVIQMNELKKLFDWALRGLWEKEAKNELSNIFLVVSKGIQDGKIRDVREVHIYLRAWLEDLAYKDAKFKQQLLQRYGSIRNAADQTFYKFDRVFARNIKLRRNLQERFEKLAEIARR